MAYDQARGEWQEGTCSSIAHLRGREIKRERLLLPL